MSFNNLENTIIITKSNYIMYVVRASNFSIWSIKCECVNYFWLLYSRLFSLGANFLNFTNILTTQEIYSGLMLYNAQLWLNIVHWGNSAWDTYALFSQYTLSLAARTIYIACSYVAITSVLSVGRCFAA